MVRIHLPIKDAILAVIRRNFPPEISSRFSVRMDSEIWKPGEDEGVWNRWKQEKEIPHVLFDMVEIFEIPLSVPKDQLEYVFLNFFKFALEDGIISFDVKPEFTDLQTAKKRKAAKKKENKEKLDQLIKEEYQKINN